MRSRRSGIIAESPRSAPRKQSATTWRYGGATPQRKSAGIVKIEPVASDVEAEPIVCERFASRIGALRAEEPEERDRHDGRGNRRRDGQPDAQAEVRVRGAEDEAEDDARRDGLRRELGEGLLERKNALRRGHGLRTLAAPDLR